MRWSRGSLPFSYCGQSSTQGYSILDFEQSIGVVTKIGQYAQPGRHRILEYATVHYRSITGRGARHILAWGWWEGFGARCFLPMVMRRQGWLGGGRLWAAVGGAPSWSWVAGALPGVGSATLRTLKLVFAPEVSVSAGQIPDRRPETAQSLPRKPLGRTMNKIANRYIFANERQQRCLRGIPRSLRGRAYLPKRGGVLRALR